MKKKLIYINSHPIQYYAPLFRKIADSGYFDFEAWYCSKHGLSNEIDKEFRTNIKWDIPILDGYKSIFLKNFIFKPNIYRFFGLFNIEMIRFFYIYPKSIFIVPGWKNFSYILAIIFGKIFGHRIFLRSEAPFNQEIIKADWKLKFRKILLGKFLFSFVDSFLYIGNQNKKFYLYYGVDESKLFFAPYAVDNQRFHSDYNRYKLKKDELRKELNLPSDGICFLYSGKYIQKKRPLDLLNAFIKANTKNAHLIFMGEGHLREQLEQLIEEHQLKNVTLTGFVNQSSVSKYYATADVFIMCSQQGETWGLSTNEAMNFCLPIILSDMTGSSEDLVEKNINGFIFPLGNIEKLSNIINDVISKSKKELSKMGAASKEKIITYSYDTIIETLKIFSN